jgi:[ribosomal protein S18]-alanine N-acetyltransferase
VERALTAEPDDLVIRPARTADVGTLLALEDEVFPTDRLNRRNFLHALRSPTITFLVAARAGRCLGYVMVHRRRRSTAGHLTSIAVAPGEAGHGLGRRLLAAAEEEAQARACAVLRLEVRADNAAAQRLYEHSGYRRSDTFEDYYEDGATAHRYEKRL